MRKIFKEDLPKKDKRVDWMNSIGNTVRFTYDGIDGELEIVGYEKEKSRVNFMYNGTEYSMFNGHLLDCKLASVIGIISKNFRFDIGQVIGEYIILDRIKVPGYKKYIVKCLSCDTINDSMVDETALMRGIGCPYCKNKKVKIGFNDVATTHPYLIKYFVDENDSMKYTAKSEKIVKAKCPYCKKEYMRKVCEILRTGVACSCSDGNSYPNKFMTSLLNQLNTKFESEYNSEWTNKKRYDHYIPGINTIIENHGRQHYEYTGFSRLFEEEQENDRLKKELAIKNGFNYCVIDCRYSELEWIKNSIMSSELPVLLDFKECDVDWVECNRFATNNLVKEVCEAWNTMGYKDIKVVANNMKINRNTIVRYLKRGTELGWCDYNPQEEYLKGVRKQGKIKGRMIQVIKDGVEIGVYPYIAELCRMSKDEFGLVFSPSGVSKVCQGKGLHHKGYMFKYIV